MFYRRSIKQRVSKEDTISRMSAEQQKVFFEYLYFGFVVNKWLQGQATVQNETDEHWAEYSTVLFSAFRFAPLVRTRVLYRGFRAVRSSELSSLAPGDRLKFMEYGYVSASTDESEAFGFARMLTSDFKTFYNLLMPDVIRRMNPIGAVEEEGIVIELQLEKGVRGLNVPTVFDASWSPDKGGWAPLVGLPDQKEVILPPGCEYFLKEITHVEKQNRNIYVAKLRDLLGLQVSQERFVKWVVTVRQPKNLQLRRLLPCPEDGTKGALVLKNQTMRYGRDLRTLRCWNGSKMQEVILSTLTT